MMAAPQYCHPPLFKRWKCLTHDAGSYNFNWLWKHEIEGVCEIVTDVTVGVVKPKTYGGVNSNGDIGRDKFPEWHQKMKFNQTQQAIKEKWEDYIHQKRIDIQKFRSGDNFADKNKKLHDY